MLRTAVCLALAVPIAAQSWVDRTTATGPSPRHGHAMCYDAAHDYVLMFGVNDTWTWNGTAWAAHGTTSIFAGGTNDHSGLAMAYHPPTGLPVLVTSNLTWTWDGATWSSRGGLPQMSGNCDYAMAFDPVRGQMVLFAGASYGAGSLNPANDTLLWDGFGWTQRQPAVRPYPTFFPHMAFDPAAGKLLLATSDLNHTQTFFWEWNGSNWNQRAYPSAPTMSGPMVTDTQHNTVLMFDASLDPQPGHTWTFSNGSSNRLGLANEPSHRAFSAGAFDPVRGKFVLFGGSNSYIVFYPDLGDTWEFALGAGAAYTVFGAGCAGSRGIPWIAAQGTSLPHTGRTFELHVGNLPFTGPVFVFLGLSNTSYGPTPLPFNLGGFGAPACNVLCSGDEVRLVTNVLGSAVWTFDVPPNFPGVTFYNQAFAIDPAANALGITASNGGQGTTGF